jgi:hypothetical protein
VKKSRSSKVRKAASTIALSATLSAPVVFSQSAYAQATKGDAAVVKQSSIANKASTALVKFYDKMVKIGQKFLIIGMDEGHTIYKNSRGEMFYIDPSTGDMKFVSMDLYMKYSETIAMKQSTQLKAVKFGIKFPEQFSIVGVDVQGNTLMENSKHEWFYLNPKTGDMVFIQ